MATANRLPRATLKPAKNPLWKTCPECHGTGADRHDPANNCSDCGGHRELVFCSICFRYDRFAPGHYASAPGPICAPCAGDLKSGLSIEQIRAQFVPDMHEEIGLQKAVA